MSLNFIWSTKTNRKKWLDPKRMSGVFYSDRLNRIHLQKEVKKDSYKKQKIVKLGIAQ